MPRSDPDPSQSWNISRVEKSNGGALKDPYCHSIKPEELSEMFYSDWNIVCISVAPAIRLLIIHTVHYMGIIHRDIKPSNMLWTHNRMRVKLTDFGVAHFSKPVNVKDGNFSTSPGTIFSDDEDHLFKTEGTPAFYAPEQAYNQNGLEVPQFPPGQRPKGVKNNSIFPLTKALDVWAFGVTIYCLLFGKPPYWGDNIFQMCKEIIEAEYETPPQVAAEMIPLTDNDPDVREALRLMKGMMTKPVYRRMTLSEAKVRSSLFCICEILIQ